jgi:glutamate carboxypeptidase
MSKLSIDGFEEQTSSLLSMLQILVEHESPSTKKPALDTLGRYIAEQMRGDGAAVECFPQEQQGDHWLGTWGNGTGGILLLVHFDTVHPIGTLHSMPWRQTKDMIYGPGCLDMKASVAIALTVIKNVVSESKDMPARLSLLCTSDEEIGSVSSRGLIERLAKTYDLVLCLEPALPDGSLKTWRKGILNYTIEAHGKAAHAGSDIHAGANAIVEIAHQIPKVLGLADAATETTVNIGVIQGGSRSNVVPEHCSIKVDVRAKSHQEGERVHRAIQALKPTVSGTELKIRGGWNRPPMERDERMQATFQRAASIASRFGMELTEGGTGGGSDANFVSTLGIPVLDGLGAIGTGAHTSSESVKLKSLPARCALLAALITEW